MRLIHKYSENKLSDVSKHEFVFEGKDFKTEFYQSNNQDLNLVTTSLDTDDKTIEIRKDENYSLYMLFDLFYQSLDNYKNKYGYDELFKTGIFSWKSDAPANELAYNEPFIYNYLNIIKEDAVYKLILINNIKERRFVIEFNTDRSRYGALVFPIWELFNSLKTLDGQITMDEYLYQKTLAKR